MKFIKRTVLLLLILIPLAFVFRGALFRSLVTYKSIGTKTIYPAENKLLTDYLESKSQKENLTDILEVVQLSLSATSFKLEYSGDKNPVDPNQLIQATKAHCVGYAAFYATACNYLLEKYELSDRWMATPHKGQLYFMGINVHDYFDSPFFKDHDFVVIKNKQTGEVIAVDPTVNDYLFIDFVTYEE